MYSNFIGEVSLSELVGYISVKMSLRPDRRLQISHEGSLVKAIHAHIVTRKWLLEATPLTYYAITPNPTDADKRALKTVATHSLITVTQKPQAAVDEVNNIDTYEQAFSFFSRILGS
jgi:hypothetical protein